MASLEDDSAIEGSEPAEEAGDKQRWQTPEAAPLTEAERKTGRWIAIGLSAALVGSLGGVLVELLFS